MERINAAQYQKLLKLNKPSKMRNVRTKVDGITFDSKAEAKYYSELQLLKRMGEVVDIQLQPRFPLLEPYERDGKKVQGITYIADFWVTYKDGRKEIIDVKGHKTDVYILKKKWFESKYPHLKIIEIRR